MTTPPKHLSGVQDAGSFSVVHPASSSPSFSSPSLPNFSLSARPTSPALLVSFESNLYSLPLSSLALHTTLTLSHASTTLRATYRNIASYPSDLLFTLPIPLTASVISCRASTPTRHFTTRLLPTSTALTLESSFHTKSLSLPTPYPTHVPTKTPPGQLPPGACTGFIPGLFRFPIRGVGSGEVVTVVCEWVDECRYMQGAYRLNLPLTFSGDTIERGKTMNDVISLHLTLHSPSIHPLCPSTPPTSPPTPEIRYECLSHDLIILSSTSSLIQLQVTDFEVNRVPHTEGDHFPPPSTDFRFSYTFACEEVGGTLLTSPPASPTSPHPFALFLSPPAVQRITAFYPRHFIFLLDRSPSMSGPFTALSRALSAVLSNLKQADMFSVGGFSQDGVVLWTTGLEPVNPHSTAVAATWVRSLVGGKRKGAERPGLDIQRALAAGLQLVEGSPGTVSYLVLATDGCMEEGKEREAVQWLEKALQGRVDVRVLVLGIGRVVNESFLREIARIGRGGCEVVWYQEGVYAAFLDLVNAHTTPVLTQMTLTLPGSPAASGWTAPTPSLQADVWPTPIPDLCLNAPLCLYGWTNESLTGPVLVEGRGGDGKVWTASLKPVTAPVGMSRLWLHDRMGAQAARVWMGAGERVGELVRTSMQQQVVCAHSTLVGYEVKEMEGEREGEGSEGRGKWEEGVVGGFVVLDRGRWLTGDVEAAKAEVNGLMDATDVPTGCCGGCASDFDWLDCLQC